MELHFSPMSYSSLLNPCFQILLIPNQVKFRSTKNVPFPSIHHLHPLHRHRLNSIPCSTAEAAPGGGDGEFAKEPNPGTSSSSQMMDDDNKVDFRSKIANLGLAGVLAYGLFDAVTYTAFFILAFQGYEKSTGKNPAANLQALLGIVILMWTGNNVTRPFRVAGAAALAPVIDRGLKKIQRYFNLPRQVYAFALVATMVAVICFTIAGLLILSRWGK